jgi:hypothetical protein
VGTSSVGIREFQNIEAAVAPKALGHSLVMSSDNFVSMHRSKAPGVPSSRRHGGSTPEGLVPAPPSCVLSRMNLNFKLPH